MNGDCHVTICARNEAQLKFAKSIYLADDYVNIIEIIDKEKNYDALIDTTGSLKLLKEVSNSKIKNNGYFYSYAVYPEMKEDKFKYPCPSDVNVIRLSPYEWLVHDEVCDLLRSNVIDSKPFISFTFEKNRIEDAWNTIKNKESVKTAIMF